MLVHGLTLAPIQRDVMEQCIRRGEPPPDSIQNAPELHIGLNLFYAAFMDLHGCRQLSEILGPIDWLTIDRYCERNGITGEQYEDMHYYVSRMDAAFLTHSRASSAAKLGAAKPTPVKRSRR